MNLSDEPLVKTTMEEKTTAFSWMMYVLLFLFALLLFIYFASMFQGLKKNDPKMTQQIIDDSVYLTYLDRMTNLEFKI